jgi:hypothetical protein
MIFSRTIYFVSFLDEVEITDRLKKITEKQYSSTKNRYKFEGEIMENKFLIYPTFDYGLNNLFRPEIEGTIEKKPNNNIQIKLNFRLSLEFRILLLTALLVNIIAIIYFYLNPIKHISAWKLYLIALPITGLIFLLSFHLKVDKSINILSKLFKEKSRL